MLDIKKPHDCCGCGGCANACPKHCVEMVYDKEGFLYPEINKDICVSCGLCEKVCPVINYSLPSENKNQKAAIVQHTDKTICSQSTSGGAFTGIAEYVIDRGGVVFGVAMDEKYDVHHISVKNKEDLVRFRNSKYVQSNTLSTFSEVKELLDSGTLVCYSGTPCQAEGLLDFLKKDYDNLILVDVVCRAVPSPGVWEKYSSFIARENDGIKSVRFRDKTLGYQYSTMFVECGNGRRLRKGSESDPWLRMFFSGMIIRPSCTQCRFRNRYRRTDFTIWDCFDIHNIDSSFDESAGTTRMFIHSEKAMAVFEEIKKDYRYKYISADDAAGSIRELRESPSFNPKRNDFYNDYPVMPVEQLISKYFPDTFKIKIKRAARLTLNKLGIDRTVKRIIKKIK